MTDTMAAPDFHDHPDDELLERFSTKTCSPLETQHLNEHLSVCESCRDSLRETGEWVMLMKRALC
jgi:hypothetical protein